MELWYAVNMNREFDDWRVRDDQNEDVLTLRFAHRADHARLAAAAPEMAQLLRDARNELAIVASYADAPDVPTYGLRVTARMYQRMINRIDDTLAKLEGQR